MTYTVKSIFKTIQGEGGNTGRVAVFCRFAGCNLWSGRERGRKKAICKFCDTDFVGGKKYKSANDLAQAIEDEWGPGRRHRMVVLTGGEPALQYDKLLYGALRKRDFYIAIETNGTVALKAHVDWCCVSPKAGTVLKQKEADELKIAFPQEFDPDSVPVAARIKSIQPIDGAPGSVREAIDFCLTHPVWRLSLQTHKFVGLQ